jgi:hypothetical protein
MMTDLVCMVNGPAPYSGWSAVCPRYCRPHGNGWYHEQNGTPCEHDGALSLNGSTKVSRGLNSSTVL